MSKRKAIDDTEDLNDNLTDDIDTNQITSNYDESSLDGKTPIDDKTTSTVLERHLQNPHNISFASPLGKRQKRSFYSEPKPRRFIVGNSIFTPRFFHLNEK